MLQRGSAAPAAEDVPERFSLLFVPAFVDVDGEAPGRTGLVIAVPGRQDDAETGQVDATGLAFLDRPRERAPRQRPEVERPPLMPSIVRQGQIASQLQDSR